MQAFARLQRLDRFVRDRKERLGKVSELALAQPKDLATLCLREIGKRN